MAKDQGLAGDDDGHRQELLGAQCEGAVKLSLTDVTHDDEVATPLVRASETIVWTR